MEALWSYVKSIYYKTAPGEDRDKPDSNYSMLDLAFAMDCTGSMSSYIKEAQRNIRSIVEEIVSKEAQSVRLALVQYRDHPPQDDTFVTSVNDFTSSVSSMKSWLDHCSAQGGGDEPEAVADALQKVLKLKWRQNATKMCVLVADAPPHGIGCGGDSLPNGCPDGHDPMAITQKLASSGISLYVVGCEPSINRYRPFFEALCHITGGQYVSLRNASLLSPVIIGGAREEISLDRLQNDVSEEIESAIQLSPGEEIDEDILIEQVYAKLQKQGATTVQLQQGHQALPEACAPAKKMAACVNLKEVRGEMQKLSQHTNQSSCASALDDTPRCSAAYSVVEQKVDRSQASRMVRKHLSKK